MPYFGSESKQGSFKRNSAICDENGVLSMQDILQQLFCLKAILALCGIPEYRFIIKDSLQAELYIISNLGITEIRSKI
ncbi:hypothetical protein XCR1_1200007 [Xenorhabdus cabanillasii JM26]|uniref:Uncharacterized protein n=1 Tax=Xenorhabdus cabanillasii JM26 TaxID=1427517 RepID=W1IMC7_9GAMM|nr:hypothetical protein XCR1_1200007 [Xenorhabdus cabanillasii JM26]